MNNFAKCSSMGGDLFSIEKHAYGAWNRENKRNLIQKCILIDIWETNTHASRTLQAFVMKVRGNGAAKASRNQSWIFPTSPLQAMQPCVCSVFCCFAITPWSSNDPSLHQITFLELRSISSQGASWRLFITSASIWFRCAIEKGLEWGERVMKIKQIHRHCSNVRTI